MDSRPAEGADKFSGTIRLRHILFAFCVGAALLCYYLLIDFRGSEPRGLSGELVTAGTALQSGGEGGLRGFLFGYLGIYTYILPLYLVFAGYMAFWREYDLRTLDLFRVGLVILGFNCLTIGLCSLFSFAGTNEFSGQGGILGDFLNEMFTGIAGPWLAPLLAVLISFAGVCLFFVTGPLTLAEKLGVLFSRYVLGHGGRVQALWQRLQAAVRARLPGRRRKPEPAEAPAQPEAAPEQGYGGVRPFTLSESNFDENRVFRSQPSGGEEVSAAHAPAPAPGPRGYFERREPVFGSPVPDIPAPAAAVAAEPEPAAALTPEESAQEARLRRAQERMAEAARTARAEQEEEARAEAARQERRRRRFAQQFGPHDDEPEYNPYARHPRESEMQTQEEETVDDGRPSTIITRGDHTRRPLYGEARDGLQGTAEAGEGEDDDLPTTIITRSSPRAAADAGPAVPSESTLPREHGWAEAAPPSAAFTPTATDDTSFAAGHAFITGDGAFASALPPASAASLPVAAAETRTHAAATMQSGGEDDPNVISFTVDQEEPPARPASFEIDEDSLPAAFIPRPSRTPGEAAPAGGPAAAAGRSGAGLERGLELISEKDSNYSYASASRGVMGAAAPASPPPPAPADALPAAGEAAASAAGAAALPGAVPAPAPTAAGEQVSSPLPAPRSAASAQLLARTNLNMISAPQHDFGMNRPSPSLLTPPAGDPQPDTQMFLDMAGKIDNFLRNFKIRATVDRYLSGPVITRYDLALEPGVKSKTIADLVNDLCRDLMVSSIRFKGIVEGSDYVGLEVPNPRRKMITLSEVVGSEDFVTSQAALPLALGVNETGSPVVVDLARAPHLLIAGTTGSGKSASLNAMLVSLLLKRSPQELRLILIDPKQLEFSLYEDIPHLITPVITDVAEKTAAALRWCVEEMERRYNLIASLRCRKLEEYNELIDRAAQTGEQVCDPAWSAAMGGTPPVLRHLPYIVVVVEEYADLMAQTGSRKKNENSPESLIARLTAKARAAGIHVILATQTPRADVVTSVIKANLPSRIAFTVQSALDSRIILDEAGAEKLLGYGDMLSKFYGYNNSATFRAHGAFVSNDDVQRVCEAWRQMGGMPEYIDGVTDSPQEEDGDEEQPPVAMKLDKVFDEAAAFARDFYARKQKYPTTSDYQANFGLGWARAKKLVNQLVQEGVVEE